MESDFQYSPRERAVLIAAGAFGLVGLNTVFAWAVVFRPESIRAALENPIALAFMAEAFLLLGLFAWLLTKWRVNRLGAGWFVALALLGTMAFALPVVLLWRRKPPPDHL